MNDGPYFLGFDGGTESMRVGIFDREGTPITFAAEPYTLKHPHPGWAEQDPAEWWACLVAAVRKAMAQSGIAPQAVAGISLDCTSPTVVALDARDRVLRPALMWMDVRAVDQARRVAETKDPALKYSGYTNASAEWMPCKALWLKENEPDTYAAAQHICEYTEWLTHRLTGEWAASINTTSVKWYYDRNAGGFPVSLYQAVGLGDLLEKFPQKVLDMGVVVGGLRKEAAEELGLPSGIPVAEGGVDAYVGMVGLNALEPGKVALITGSSHVILAQVAKPIYSAGFFGAFTDAVLTGQYTIEGAQASTGSVVNWFRDRFCGVEIELARQEGISVYDLLNRSAESVPLGSEGLMVLDYWQGNRTPYTDAQARGMIWGLSLRHEKKHIYHAIIEGICYGTEHIFRTLRENGFVPKEIIASGGPVKSQLWMQIHADVSGLPISLTKVADAGVLGSAILAAVGAGTYPSIQEAARHMVHASRLIEPDPVRHQEYQFYVDKYIATYPQMRDLMHNMIQHVADSNV